MCRTRPIFCFSDGSFDLESAIQALTSSYRESSLQAKFVHSVTKVLRDEIQVATAIPDELRSISSSLLELSRCRHAGNIHPAVHAALVVIVHLGSIVSWVHQHEHENQPCEPFAGADSTCVGFCLGEISAAVLAMSKSLLHLMELSLTAVRVAFRTGLLAAEVGESIEREYAPQRSWALSLGRDLNITDKLLHDFHDAESIPPSKHLWIGYIGRTSITVFGPPSSLELLLAWLKRSSPSNSHVAARWIPIHAPYHSGRLYTRQSIQRSLADLSPSLQGDRNCILINSSDTSTSTNGDEDNCEASRLAMRILMSPMLWSDTLGAVKARLQNDDDITYEVRGYGSNVAAQQLVSALKSHKSVKMREPLDRDTAPRAQSKQMPIAIIGTAMRLPSASDADELWNLLLEGKRLHKTVPKDRFDPDTHLKSKAYGCFIDNLGHFDARFFNISPREASQMDPGHRLAMMTALEAMEDAGLVVDRTPSTQSHRIGTFYGQTVDEYKEQNMTLNVDTYYIPGSLRAFAPGRINYFFKFGGPAYSIDTACSSGAVAMNLACRSIWSGECDTALAGGINTLCGCDNTNGLIAGQFLSSTGGCKTFDEDADGYCRGEAICSLVFKRLDAAQADRDRILGVISATASNYPTEALSITRPHGPTQESLYRTLLQEAGLQHSDVDYVELHGTGTQAGDQVETQSVVSVFASPSRPLYISAIKPNVGHSEAASGTTSLIKALKVFQEGRIPPHVGIQGKRNKLLPDFDHHNVKVSNQEMEYLRSPGKVHRAVVSNFSAAGGCTSFLIEEAPPKSRQFSPQSSRFEYPVCLSAKSKGSFAEAGRRLKTWLATQNDENLVADLSYTSSARRAHYSWRKAFSISSKEDLEQKLNDLSEPRMSTPPKIAFAFTGQGSWYEGVGAELMRTNAVFRDALHSMNDACISLGLDSFIDLILAEDSIDASPMRSQLAVVAVEMALLRLWSSWGIKEPVAVIGHSLGEYSALYAAGVLGERDVLHLVGERARLLETLCKPQTHSMLAIQATVQAVQDVLKNTNSGVELACINGPADCVFSGPVDDVTALAALLSEASIKSTQLNLPYGFHSSQVDPILEPFKHLSSKVSFKPPHTPVASTSLAKVVQTEGVFDAGYLGRQCRGTVDFQGALSALEKQNIIDENTIWIEMGPQPLCSRMITKTLGSQIQTLPSMKKGTDVWTTLCHAAVDLYNAGCDLDWHNYHRDAEQDLSLIRMPTYAFELKKHWIPYNDFLLRRNSPHGPDSSSDPALQDQSSLISTSVHRMTKCAEDPSGIVNIDFETLLSEVDIHGTVMGHAVGGVGLLPASVYGDVAITVGNVVKDRFPSSSFNDALDICNMDIFKPITVPKDRSKTTGILRISATAHLLEGIINIGFLLNDDAQARATCTLAAGDSSKWKAQWSRVQHHTMRSFDLLQESVVAGKSHKMQRSMVYKLFASVVDYDPKYQAMQEVTMNSEQLEASARLELYQGNDGGKYHCSPFWIDAIVHLAGFVMNANETIDTNKGVYISGGWENMKFAELIDPTATYRVYVKMVQNGQGHVAGDVVLVRDDEIVGMIENLKFQRVPRQLLSKILTPERGEVHSPKLKPHTAAPTPLRHAQTPPEKATVNSSAKSWEAAHKVIADEAGVDVAELTDEVSLISLGIDSLLSLTIADRLHQVCDVALDQDALLACNTIKDLRDAIGATEEVDETHLDPTSDCSSSHESSGIATPAEGSALNSDDALALRSIVAKQIGIDAEELLADQALSELGVDSLLSWSISTELENSLGVAIPAEILSSAATLESLEDRLMSAQKNVSTPQNKVCSQDHERASNTGADRARAKPLLLHRGSGSRCLFLLPDGGGSPAAYIPLPSIDESMSVWAFSLPDAPATKAEESVEGFADVWVQQILEVQPGGPYHIAGWSAGGFFALEVVRRLLAAGKVVQNLILIDSPCPLLYEPMPLSFLAMLFREGVFGTRPSASSNAKLERNFQRTIGALAKYRPKELQMDNQHGSRPKVSLIWAAAGLDEHLTPDVSEKARDGTKIVDFLLSRRGYRGTDGWEQILGGDMSVDTSEGHHFSIVREQGGQSLASGIRRALQASH